MNFETKHNDAPETKHVIVDEKGGVFSFTKAFSYLESNIDFLIDGIEDAKNRISKFSKSM